MRDAAQCRKSAGALLECSTTTTYRSSMQNKMTHVNGIDLRMSDPVDLALQQMYFGWKGIVEDSNALLAAHGLARAHHRILFVVARADGIAVGALLHALGITAQALQRPMAALIDKGFVTVRRDPLQHRRKMLSLTEAGKQIEHDASEAQRVIFRRAFAAAGAQAADGWSAVMEAIYLTRHV